MIATFLGRVPSPDTIGPEFDFLAETTPKFDPPFRQTMAMKRAAVVACMRNEGIVILEWVAHYRALGFDSIFIYTNANDDGSDELLLALHKTKIITLIWNNCAPGVRPQYKAYRHAFWHNQKVWKHDWVAFLDADEFLIPVIDGRQMPISEYLHRVEYRFNCAAISLNWRWFAGNQEFDRREGLLFERYRRAGWNHHVKTLFRLRDAYDVHIHCPKLLPDRIMIGGSGGQRALPSHEEEPSGLLGQVNHYWQRSFQEFYIKRERGLGDTSGKRDYSSFFDWRYGADEDQFPVGAHIDKVHAQIAAFRRNRAVRCARRLVEARFAECADSSLVREAYAAARSSSTTSAAA